MGDGCERPDRVLVPADGRHHRDDTFDALVSCSHDQAVTAGIAGAPQTDAICVDFGAASHIGDRIAHVGNLLPRIDLAAQRPAARPGVAMVVDEAGEARFAEHIGVLIERHFFDCAETMAEHDCGKRSATAVGSLEKRCERCSVQ